MSCSICGNWISQCTWCSSGNIAPRGGEYDSSNNHLEGYGFIFLGMFAMLFVAFIGLTTLIMVGAKLA